MRLLNRNMEVALNVLHTLYNAGSETPSGPVLARQLGESEFLVYRVLQRLKDLGYLTTTRGAAGRYQIQPHVPELTMKQFLEAYNRDWAPNPVLSGNSASTKFGAYMTVVLTLVSLGDLFRDTPISITPLRHA